MSIRIIIEPSMFLVGRQTIDDAALDRFLASEGDGAENWETDTMVHSQKLVETAGRLCYKSYAKPRPGGNAAYIGHILEVGHGSVLEHAVFNLIVKGVSRSLTHELVRHRVGISPSQRSQRYCDEGEAAFVVPPAYLDDVRNAMRFFDLYRESSSFDSYADAYDRSSVGVPGSWEAESILFGLEWLASMEYAIDKYERFSERGEKKLALRAWVKSGGSLDAPSGAIDKFLAGGAMASQDKTARRKAAREAARSVLPNATETQIFITANARALRHFIEMRGSAAADAEMRRLAVAMLTVLTEEAGNLFGDYVVTPTDDGGATIDTKNRKV